MKKISIGMIILLIVLHLTGCTQKVEDTWNQEKVKVVYVTAISKEILPLTNAYMDLHTIYTNPLAYSLDERKTKFEQDKKTIEESYARIQQLTVPPEFADVHQVLLTSLETTIEVNQAVAQAINTGQAVGQKAIDTLDSATKQLKEFSSSWDRLKGLPEHQ